jgi:hypothetical protein
MDLSFSGVGPTKPPPKDRPITSRLQDVRTHNGWAEQQDFEAKVIHSSEPAALPKSSHRPPLLSGQQYGSKGAVIFRPQPRLQVPCNALDQLPVRVSRTDPKLQALARSAVHGDLTNSMPRS